jgi:hypothetical protein
MNVPGKLKYPGFEAVLFLEGMPVLDDPVKDSG